MLCQERRARKEKRKKGAKGAEARAGGGRRRGARGAAAEASHGAADAAPQNASVSCVAMHVRRTDKHTEDHRTRDRTFGDFAQVT
jgi:hypothetical protein